MLSSIQNYHERLVMECIQDSLAGTDTLADPDYVDDLACIALNTLPPRYVRHPVDFASHLGDEERRTIQAQVAEAVGQAIETIARRHAGR
ncbi:late competence development ComFB family protein [Thiocystis violacea]|uniref:late competence development ComFB family protein n=1 Tax=Thiocystis violacea TaxID=13725 RepID=UPI0019066B5B|nr:late competence development ComFB family protein [Thiocystis violacea]MBK1721321.1 competence protein ComFB [Thiocystis violacea]